MLKAGDVYENPVTGERAVIRVGTDTTGGDLLVVDLYVRPGGAVAGEHYTVRLGFGLRGGWRSRSQEFSSSPRRALLTTGGMPDRRKRSSEWRWGRLPGLRPRFATRSGSHKTER
jgi:hypothetical protein